MASIFKQITIRPLPADAEIITKNSKKFIRLKREGRAIIRELTDCGTKYRDESKKWYIKFKDRHGAWRRVPGYSDKAATVQLAAELERNQEQIQSGLTDAHEQGKLCNLHEHLTDFQQYLISKNNTAHHVMQTCRKIRRIIDGCGFKCWKDIISSKVSNWLALQRNSGSMGIKTSNYYQSSFKGFCTWMVRDGRVPSNPVSHLQSLNSNTDIRRKRRVLSDSEFVALVESAMNGPPVQCIDGPDRAMLYILAAWTGYRKGELASLTLQSFDLTSTPATVVCKAGYSKRRRNDVIPLHEVVVIRFKEWLASKGKLKLDEPLFPLRSKGGSLRQTSKMMQADLERANIPYCDENGLYADFHASRHTFISNLARAGVSPKLAQSIARHSDVNLTLGVYSHVHVDEQATAINTLSAPPTASLPPKRASKSLDNKSSTDESVVHIVVQNSDSARPSEAMTVSRENSEKNNSANKEGHKPLPEKALVNICQRMLANGESSGRGTRTPDTWIMIPLL